MRITGLAILALLVALLGSAGMATPCQAQGPRSEVERSAKDLATKPGRKAMPNFVGLMRGEASRLARQTSLEPAFDGAASKDARVASQSPQAGAPILRAGMSVRLQMEAPDLPLQSVPNFVGLIRGEVSRLARQYGLEPAFDGAASKDARAASQSPAAGAPILRAGTPVRLQMEARNLPVQRVPKFVGLSRVEANALAQQYSLTPFFNGGTSNDARVGSQAPDVGKQISAVGMAVRLQMDVQTPPPQRVPNFVGLTRGRAGALAKRYGLEPVFHGATGKDAHVNSQSPGLGTLIVHTGISVRLQMETQAPATPPPSPAPAPLRASTPQPASAPAPLTPAPQSTPPPAPQSSPTAAPQPSSTPAQQTTPPPASHPTSTPPPPSPTANACVPRDLVSWLTAAPRKGASATCQGSETRNWLILLAIAAGLTGGTWALFRRLRTLGTPEHIDPKTNDLKIGKTARLTTQTLSAGFAGITVSIQAADARRFEVRYVMERDARPGPASTRIDISVDGDDDDR